MRFVSAVALAAVMLWVPVDGVAQDRNPLAGVTSVDPTVYLTWDDRITLKTESQFDRQAEDALELELLRAGLTVDPDAPNFVACTIVLVTREGNSVAYAWHVAYTERVWPWLLPPARQGDPENRQWADTWSQMGTGTVGVSNLEGAEFGRRCAEQFELAWRRANN